MREIDVPGEVTVEIDGPDLEVSGPAGTVSRRLTYPGVTIEEGNGYVRVSAEKRKKTLLAMEGTLASHVRNMVRGVTDGFEYRLRVLYSHFPIQVKVQGDRVFIENFMGENHPRKAKIVEGAGVEVKGEDVLVTGADNESAGQTAANIEQATRIKGKDPRVFQDGVYIVEKP
ncbi:MAG: 50S ribosomal protein L6 [Methanonatronarchaeales archaeon]|nr:50S ribosomal protein L6 [Methanonatronarchaeales archaeon]